MTDLPKKEAARLQKSMGDAYDEHEKGLNRHSFFKVHNRELSEDLVQDTFMKTWKYLVHGGRIDAMRGFLYHTLNCLIIDEYRRSKTSSLDALLEKGFEPGADTNERLMNMLDGKSALRLIAKLPPKYEKAVRLRYVQHLTLEEMATLSGQSKNTVAVQVHRGVKLLRALYERPDIAVA